MKRSPKVRMPCFSPWQSGRCHPTPRGAAHKLRTVIKGTLTARPIATASVSANMPAALVGIARTKMPSSLRHEATQRAAGFTASGLRGPLRHRCPLQRKRRPRGIRPRHDGSLDPPISRRASVRPTEIAPPSIESWSAQSERHRLRKTCIPHSSRLLLASGVGSPVVPRVWPRTVQKSVDAKPHTVTTRGRRPFAAEMDMAPGYRARTDDRNS